MIVNRLFQASYNTKREARDFSKLKRLKNTAGGIEIGKNVVDQFFNAHKGYCAVPENIHTHPMEGQWKFREGGGGLKSQNFKRKVWSLSGNSRGVGGGGGVKPKNLPWEGYGYFMEQHILSQEAMQAL